MFTWLDLVAPIGVCVGGAGLCLWAAVMGKAKNKTIARIICIATAIVFAGGIPAWYIVRDQTTKPDYTTLHGIGVKQGEINKCPESLINEWTEWLFAFWGKHYAFEVVKKSVKGKLLVCVDAEKLSVLGRSVRGYSHGKFAVIGWNGKPSYTRSLFIHEMSHQIVDSFVPYSEEGHHKLFKDKGLGH